MKKNIYRKAVALLLVIMGLSSCTTHTHYQNSSSVPKQQPTQPLTQEQTDISIIKLAKKAGIITSISGNKASVDTFSWKSLTYEQKVGLALAFSNVYKINGELNFIDIRCAYTHKTLATYNDAWGFTLY